MGSAFTAPADRGAGQQAGWRPLSLYEAEEALFEEIEVLIRMVGQIRADLHRHHGVDSPVNARVDALEERITVLEVVVDHVRIRIVPGEGTGS